ncbi:hypothetical protein Mapa_000536 [Marchantia paleacea]|nr:hypothetical protein Mapa_000536 [Marchantia paleacea]
MLSCLNTTSCSDLSSGSATIRLYEEGEEALPCRSSCSLWRCLLSGLSFLISDLDPSSSASARRSSSRKSDRSKSPPSYSGGDWLAGSGSILKHSLEALKHSLSPGLSETVAVPVDLALRTTSCSPEFPSTETTSFESILEIGSVVESSTLRKLFRRTTSLMYEVVGKLARERKALVAGKGESSVQEVHCTS